MPMLKLYLVILISASSLLADNYDLKLPSNVTRPWVAPEIWTTPMMDWQLSEGRVEITQGLSLIHI